MFFDVFLTKIFYSYLDARWYLKYLTANRSHLTVHFCCDAKKFPLCSNCSSYLQWTYCSRCDVSCNFIQSSDENMLIGSVCSDVVLEARPWPRASSRPIFYGLGLGVGIESLSLGLDSCDDHVLTLPSNSKRDNCCWSKVKSSVAAGFGQHGMPPPICNPDFWPFDLETGVWVASKMGNLYSKFGLARLLGSQIICYVRDGRTDKSNAYCPFPMIGA